MDKKAAVRTSVVIEEHHDQRLVRHDFSDHTPSVISHNFYVPAARAWVRSRTAAVRGAPRTRSSCAPDGPANLPRVRPR